MVSLDTYFVQRQYVVVSLAAPTSRVFEARNANRTGIDNVGKDDKESERNTGKNKTDMTVTITITMTIA